MKKYSILLMSALGLLAASCDDAPATAPVQTNPQEPILAVGNLEQQIAGPLTSAEPLMLQDYAEAGLVPVMKLDAAKDLPADAQINYVFELSADEAFSKTVSVTAVAGEPEAEARPEEAGQMYYVKAEEWNNAQIELFGTGLKPHKTFYRVPVYVILDGSNYRYDSDSYYAATGSVDVARLTPDYVIEEAYYLVGNFCDWDVKKGIKMTQTDATAEDLYASPVFAAKFDVAAGDLPFQWKVVPQSAVDAGNWDGAWAAQPDSVGALFGTLVASPEAGTGAAAAEITTASSYVIQINAQALTYQQTFAFDFLYVPGTATSLGYRQALKLTTTDYINYSGVSRLRNQWWMTSEQSLQRGTVFYQAPDDAKVEVSESGVYTYTGGLTTDSSVGQPLVIGSTQEGTAIDGLFWIEANTAALNYKAIWLQSIEVIGGFNEWDTATAIAMTPNNRFTTWTVKDIDMKAGEYKFCTNRSWTISFGGALDAIEQNGGNLVCEEDGKYDITLDFTTTPYTCKVVKK